MELHVNHKFLLDRATRYGGRILDFGCGTGALVQAGVAAGLGIYGCDNASCIPDSGSAVDIRRRLGDHLISIGPDDRVLCPDGYFDLIVSNQVFEHVAKLDRVLGEMRRILKPTGTMIHLFPSREVWREGHCKVPFAHRVKAQGLFLRAGRAVGFGHDRHYFPHPSQWVENWQTFLRDKCFYRRSRDLKNAFEAAGFSFTNIEAEYALYRARTTVPSFASVVSAMPGIAAVAIRKLAGMVVLSRCL